LSCPALQFRAGVVVLRELAPAHCEASIATTATCLSTDGVLCARRRGIPVALALVLAPANPAGVADRPEEPRLRPSVDTPARPVQRIPRRVRWT
jgi:hypothetical protein